MPRLLPRRIATLPMTKEILSEVAVVALNQGLSEFDAWIQSIAAEDLEFVFFDLIGFSELRWISVAKYRGLNVDARTDEGHSIFVEAVYLWSQSLGSDGFHVRRRIFLNILELLSLGADPNPRPTDPFSATALAVALDIPELATLFFLGGANLGCGEPDDNTSNRTLRETLLASGKPWSDLLVNIAQGA